MKKRSDNSPNLIPKDIMMPGQENSPEPSSNSAPGANPNAPFYHPKEKVTKHPGPGLPLAIVVIVLVGITIAVFVWQAQKLRQEQRDLFGRGFWETIA